MAISEWLQIKERFKFSVPAGCIIFLNSYNSAFIVCAVHVVYRFAIMFILINSKSPL